MKKSTLIILIFLILLSNASLKAEEYYDISQYFPMDVGNKWVYWTYSARGEEASGEGTRVSSIESKETLNGRDVYLFKMYQEAGSIFYYSLDKRGIYLDKISEEDEYVIFSPPVLLFPNNLKFNQKLKLSSSAKVYNSNGKLIDKGTIKGEVIAKDIEDITVPAGRFEDCLRIYSLLNYKLKRTLTVMTNTTWFAQNVGKIKEKHLATSYTEKETDYKESKLKRATIKGKTIGN